MLRSHLHGIVLEASEKHLRVLFVAPFPPPRHGISVYSERLFGELSKIEGLEVIRLDVRSEDKKYLSASRIPRLISRIFRAHSTWNFHLIHTQCLLVPGIASLIASKLLGKPLILTFHGSGIVPKTYFGLGRSRLILSKPLAKLLSLLSEYSVAVSPWIKEELPRSVFLPPGFPKTSRSTHRERKICFVGRLTEEKNPLPLLEAVSRIEDENLKLVFIGNGPLRKKLELRAKDLSMDSKVLFLGEVSEKEVLDHIRSSMLLVIPSEYEVFPLVLTEALSSGTPVLVSEGKWSEWIRFKGVIRSPTSPEELSNKIKEVLSRIDELTAEISMEDFPSWEEISRAYYSIYKLLAGGEID